MRWAADAVRTGLGRADELLLAWRDRLTPGQRWTSAILATLSLAVLLFGAPGLTVVAPGRPTSAAASPTSPAPDVTRVPITVDALGGPAPLVPSVPSGGGETASSSGAAAATTAIADVEAPLRITALLPAASGQGVPGRREVDVAAVFLAQEGLEVAARSPVDDPAACATVGGPTTLVVAPEDVPAELRTCLRTSGATLLAFDAGGSEPGVLSTRRAGPAALRLLATWAASNRGVLDGTVGIVGGDADERWIRPLVPELRQAGLDVVATAFVGEDQVGGAVRNFVAAGVDGVVLAAPAAVQRQWTAQHALLEPGVRFVVADAHDGVMSETYAPTFDGALAHTTLRGAWYARAHGETAEQQRCRETWEAAATPPRMLSSEARWVYAWCQHTALAASLSTGGIPLDQVPRRVRMASPLTSEVGPSPVGWGPRRAAIVVWRSSCTCWVEARPFQA